MWKPSLLAVVILSSCASPLPTWDGKIYQGDPRAIIGADGVARPGVVRRQDNEIILADDDAFGDFMAMRWADFRTFTETFVFSCKEWDERSTLSIDEIKKFLQSLKDVPR